MCVCVCEGGNCLNKVVYFWLLNREQNFFLFVYQFRCTFCKWKMKHAQCILRVWSDTLSPATSSHDWLRTEEADLIYYDHTQQFNLEIVNVALSCCHCTHFIIPRVRATSIQKFYPKLLKNSICHYITSYSLLGWTDWQTKMDTRRRNNKNNNNENSPRFSTILASRARDDNRPSGKKRGMK